MTEHDFIYLFDEIVPIRLFYGPLVPSTRGVGHRVVVTRARSRAPALLISCSLVALPRISFHFSAGHGRVPGSRHGWHVPQVRPRLPRPFPLRLPLPFPLRLPLPFPSLPRSPFLVPFPSHVLSCILHPPTSILVASLSVFFPLPLLLSHSVRWRWSDKFFCNHTTILGVSPRGFAAAAAQSGT